MKRLYAVLIVITLLVMVGPVSAQTVFSQGVYQFEDYIANMSYTGTWTTTASGAASTRTTSTASASLTFYVSGKYLVVWHLVPASNASSRFDFCVGASCQNVLSESGATVATWYPHTVALAAGTNTITITRTAGTIYFDYFMILADPTVLTPVPTATILPSSTPAYTATPGPTPVYTATAVPTSTPAPTVTPYTFPGVIYALDPAASYSSRDGMITAIDYKVDGGQIHLANLLTLLLLSVWGFFLFVLFVLVRYRK